MNNEDNELAIPSPDFTVLLDEYEDRSLLEGTSYDYRTPLDLANRRTYIRNRAEDAKYNERLFYLIKIQSSIWFFIAVALTVIAFKL